ncbi:30S ribosomal protein S9 [Patescibacteria group bacterium]|nr:30S ribosomal protein S9 [Patescibacteria group bacterium]
MKKTKTKKSTIKKKKTIRKKKPTKKRKPKKIKKKVEKPKVKPEKEKYFEAVGRRKTAVARIRLFTKGEKKFLVNEKPFDIYFPTFELRQIAQAALKKMKCLDRFRISAKVKGGGYHSQAEAVRHGISRTLVLFNSYFRKRLKKAGFLTRDSRMRERKKFGLKRARKAPQWQKR